MNITTKIIITDTNIITDLDNANILKKFVMLDNVYISDFVRNDEINDSTGNKDIILKFKVLTASEEQVKQTVNLLKRHKGLSFYDLINYCLAKDNDGYLATGDKKLKNFAEENNVPVLRTLKIIKLMYENNYLNYQEAISACELLKENNSTRIPLKDINKMMEDIKNSKLKVH